MITSILDITLIILAVLLVVFILLQARGAGVGGIFGGGGNVYLAKRGIEKKLFQATIVVAVLFFGVALVNVLI
ncbi:MAG: preprotein translocase subunit SecG [Candidatus Uhrbacteria bacterium]